MTYKLPTGISCATRTLTAVAEDSAGQTASSSVQIGIAAGDCVTPTPTATPTATATVTPQPTVQPPGGPSVEFVDAPLRLPTSGADFEVEPHAPAGLKQVDVFLGTTRICTLTTTPFSCRIRPTGGDVGIQEVRAVISDLAGSTAADTVRVEVPRFEPRGLDVKVKSDGRKRTITAELKLPNRVSENEGCSNGTITLITKRNGKLYDNSELRLKGSCTVKKKLTTPRDALSGRALQRQSRPRTGQRQVAEGQEMNSRLIGALALAAAFFVAAPAAHAQVDPAGCTSDLQYDPSIPTYNSVLGTALGSGTTGSSARRLTLELQTYQRAVVNATQNNPRVRVIEKKMSDTALGAEVTYSVISTPENIANLDAGRNDAAFWAGVREGNISTNEGLSQIRNRPAFTWVTATPHGNEPAAGEASMRLLYEMAARLDCSNARRLQNLTTFIVPVTNPDGRDRNARTTAWGFDPNRDRGTRVNIENDGFTEAIVKYPGVFVIDAHQQGSGYFFPPNEDAVHHEVSQFAVDFIQNDIGPVLQRMFNDQTVAYQNYNVYDLFAPIYGDSVPALLDGAAGMTYEKGSNEVYGKQVYDHYLAMDATQNVTSDQKVQVLDGWVRQWGEARQQGSECQLQMNKLVSPLHTQIFDQPNASVCGYFFPPGQSSGDTARLIHELTSVGVHVYKLNTAVNAAGVHPFGFGEYTPNPSPRVQTLPAGTLYVPMNQGQKHWIQAILGEDPYLPYPYNYDVVQWSYPLTRGLAASGFMTQPFPPGVTMTEITDPNYGTVSGAGSAVYAFDTDSAQGLGMVMELLDKNVQVSRAAAGFTAGGRTFKTGAALVDGSTLGVDRPGGDREDAADPGHGHAELPGPALRAAEAEDRPLQQHGGGPRQPDPARRRREEQLLRQLLRVAVRAHAEDEDPGVADPPDLGDGPGRGPAGHRPVHRVHQPGRVARAHRRAADAGPDGDPELRQPAAAATSAPAPTAPRRPATRG